jgi:hypothetical protein
MFGIQQSSLLVEQLNEAAAVPNLTRVVTKQTVLALPAPKPGTKRLVYHSCRSPKGGALMADEPSAKMSITCEVCG